MSTPTSSQTMSATTTESAKPSCVTATPGKYGHVPTDACNSYYNFDPNFPAAIAFTVFFGLATLTHFVQAVVLRKGFCWVIIMAALWLTVSFVTRALGAHDQQNIGYATTSQLLLLLAPLWINAFVYMTLGRMIYFYLPEQKIFGIKARRLAMYFVLLDIVSFIIQGVGGSMISPTADKNVILTGIHLYMAGIGVQEFFIAIFIVIAVTFHRRMLVLEQRGETRRRTKWLRLIVTLYAVLVMITVRIIYRLVEYSRGIDPSNPIPYHEAYAYCLDALPMLAALTLLCIVHPGMSLVGPDSHFPSRKERKALKKEKKAKKKAAKEGRQRSRHSPSRHSPSRHSRSRARHSVTEDAGTNLEAFEQRPRRERRSSRA